MTAPGCPAPQRLRSVLAWAIGAALLLAAAARCARPPGGPRAAATPARETWLEADGLRQEGDVDAALREYRRAVDLDPAAVRPHLRYVRALIEVGRGSTARAHYEERSRAPDATDAERTIAERLRTSGASSALRRVYTAAAERAPGVSWWRLALAEVEIAEADAWNQKRLDAIDRGDRDEEVRAFDQAGGAVRRAQRALLRAARLDADLAEVHLYRGCLRAVEGDLISVGTGRSAAYTAAAAAFARAVAIDPDLVEAWSGLGDAHFRTGDLRESLRACLEAVRRAPANPQYRIALGVVLHELERLREAAEQYRQAARLVAWDADPLIRLGDARADARNYPKALAAYREALDRDADAVEAYYKLGTLLEFLGRRGEARAAYERYVAQDGPRAGAVQRRIERLLRQEAR